MEDLAYFAANAPDRTVRRTGRLNAAAIILLLVTLPIAWIALQTGQEFLDFAYRGRIEPEYVFMLALTGSSAAYFLLSAIALVTRRRWSRPLVLIAMRTWLTYGVIGVLLLLIMEIRSPYQNGFEYYRIDQVLIEVVLTAFFSVGVPWLVYLLVRPTDVRLTLEYYDTKSRRSDTWSVLRGSTVLTLLVTAVICASFLANMRYSYWWPTDLKPWMSVGSTVVLFLVSAAALAFGASRVGGRIALACLGVAVVLLIYIGLQGGSRRPFNYSDSSLVLGYAIALDVACALQIRHIGTMPEAAEANDGLIANTQ